MAMTSTTRPPVARQVSVTVSFVLMVIGSVIGVGALGGTPISEAAGGLLSTQATHIAPASSAFTLWSVVYAGLGAYTLWQWWDRTDQRRIAWLAVASMLLNAVWILVIQAGIIELSVLVIVALLVVLTVMFRRMTPAATGLQRLVVDGSFGLYLGWVCVATCANIAAALAGAGFEGWGVPEVLAIAVLAVPSAVGIALVLVRRGTLAAPLALGWGLVWIAVARGTDQPESLPVALTAAALAVLVVGPAVVRAIARRR